ncbi:MAG TPA: hypothetical protein VFQ15_01390 [Jiangellaceae bacterium]|nr:hypothetical protein [Jiangellaceae bacterium]
MRACIGAATTRGGGSPASAVTVVEVDGSATTIIGQSVQDQPDPMYLALSRDGPVL